MSRDSVGRLLLIFDAKAVERGWTGPRTARTGKTNKRSALTTCSIRATDIEGPEARLPSDTMLLIPDNNAADTLPMRAGPKKSTKIASVGPSADAVAMPRPASGETRHVAKLGASQKHQNYCCFIAETRAVILRTRTQKSVRIT